MLLSEQDTKLRERSMFRNIQFSLDRKIAVCELNSIFSKFNLEASLPFFCLSALNKMYSASYQPARAFLRSGNCSAGKEIHFLCELEYGLRCSQNTAIGPIPHPIKLIPHSTFCSSKIYLYITSALLQFSKAVVSSFVFPYCSMTISSPRDTKLLSSYLFL